MRVIDVDLKQLLAITVTDDGWIQRWGTTKSNLTKVFRDSQGHKAILYFSYEYKEDVS